MTNAQGGQLLAYDLVRSIASVYGWPDFHPIVRTTVKVEPAVLATYVGVYEFPKFSIAITLENGQLMEQAGNQRKFPIFPQPQSKFFLKAVPARLEFFRDANGRISHLVLRQNGVDTRGERKQ